MAQVHARHYSAIGDVELYFWNRSADRRLEFSNRFQATPCGSIDELIDRVDAVDICLPTDLHFETAMRVLEAQKPLLVEKPFTRTLDEGIALAEFAQEREVPVMVAHVVRYFEEFERARELVLSGSIGRPVVARTRRGGGAPSGSDNWLINISRSGGVLLDLVIHDFDWIQWTFGRVESVFSSSLSAKFGNGPDYALTSLKVEGGVLAHVEATWKDPAGFRTSIEVSGSDGLIQFDSKDCVSLAFNSEDRRTAMRPRSQQADPYRRELEAFLAMSFDGAPSPIPPRDALNSLAISLAALESAHTRQPVSPVWFPI